MCAASTRSPRRCSTSGASGCWRRQDGLGEPAGQTAEQAELDRLKRRVGQLERALDHKTYELEVAGELSRDWE
jgi:hypothetical protein